MTRPYPPAQWQMIDALGHAIDQQLTQLGVGLTMGGEPTFVSVTDLDTPQWQVAALGEDKRRIAGQLLLQLAKRFALSGEILHYGQGKWYPGEALPRWALGCYWRPDGQPLWHDHRLLAEDGQDYRYDCAIADRFIQRLTQQLGIDAGLAITAYEPDTDEPVGYVLPLLPLQVAGQVGWSSCQWQLPTERLTLIAGDSAIGYRLPLSLLPESVEAIIEAIQPLDGQSTQPLSPPYEAPPNSIRIALGVSVKQGALYIFMPPLASPLGYANLISTIELVAQDLQTPIFLEGYTPPGNSGILGFQVTPDPGVIEVNIHPTCHWAELKTMTTNLYETAQSVGLSPSKYSLDGRLLASGGGCHITIGGKTLRESPLLRRPDLLRSLIGYWQNHPSLSFLFAGLFVGPTSQSPRPDEARHESLYEFEIAFQTLVPGVETPPWLVDRLLRNLMIDVTGNTHRSALCIDKLYPVENPRNQLGLLEFRGFEMPPNAEMNLLQMLLIRGLVARFWEQPYTSQLIRWGTTLHDRFMLPHYIGEDLQLVVQGLQKAGYSFEFDWFRPFFEFRFPSYGAVDLPVPSGTPITLELRHAIEPWHVLGEESTSSGTARYVDASMERIQVKLTGALGNSAHFDSFASRYNVTCNGYLVPMKSTGVQGEYVGAVRFRARQYATLLHPAIALHTPLEFAVIDDWHQQHLGGCTYHVNRPNGEVYTTFPQDQAAAATRLAERFIPQVGGVQDFKVHPLHLNPEYPLTLDLRRLPNFP